MKEKILVFARAPVAGRCKTRLIPAYGPRGAARLHRRLVEKTLSIACASGAIVELWCAPDARHGFFHACRRRYGVALKRQALGDLGRKMALALRDALQGATQVVIVGTDCAVLSAQDLRAALAALVTHDAVLQPATDGGYVLIGARLSAPSALRGVDWSSGCECRQTLTRLARRQLAVAQQPARWDVDHPRDVRKAKALGLI